MDDHAKRIFGHAPGNVGFGEVPTQQVGHVAQEQVSAAKADAFEHRLVVVQLHQDQSLIGLSGVRRSHRAIKLAAEILAIEQFSDEVLAAQLFEFLGRAGVGFLLAEHDLLAGFAFVHRLSKLHHGIEGGTIRALRLEVQFLRWALALGQTLEQ